MKKFLLFLLLLGCFSIEQTIWIKSDYKYDLMYKVKMPLAIIQMISEDSIKEYLKDENAKYLNIQTDTSSSITTIEIFYENLTLDELIEKDSSLKFYKGKDYLEFYKVISPLDTLTRNLVPFLTDENHYKLVVISENKILQSNADSVSENKLVWQFPLKKLYNMKVGDSIKVIFRVKQ